MPEFDDIEKLKSFIQWCKSEKLARIKVKDIEFEFYPLSFLDDVEDVALTSEEISEHGTKTLVDEEPVAPEDDPDLFYSSGS